MIWLKTVPKTGTLATLCWWGWVFPQKMTALLPQGSWKWSLIKSRKVYLVWKIRGYAWVINIWIRIGDTNTRMCFHQSLRQAKRRSTHLCLQNITLNPCCYVLVSLALTYDQTLCNFLEVTWARKAYHHCDTYG